jgi:hypothetical protein
MISIGLKSEKFKIAFATCRLQHLDSTLINTLVKYREQNFYPDSLALLTSFAKILLTLGAEQ